MIVLLIVLGSLALYLLAGSLAARYTVPKCIQNNYNHVAVEKEAAQAEVQWERVKHSYDYKPDYYHTADEVRAEARHKAVIDAAFIRNMTIVFPWILFPIYFIGSHAKPIESYAPWYQEEKANEFQAQLAELEVSYEKFKKETSSRAKELGL